MFLEEQLTYTPLLFSAKVSGGTAHAGCEQRRPGSPTPGPSTQPSEPRGITTIFFIFYLIFNLFITSPVNLGRKEAN